MPRDAPAGHDSHGDERAQRTASGSDSRGVDPSARRAPDDITVRVPVDHPAFAGHFPGHPVLPGVVLLAEVLAAVEHALELPIDRIVIKVAKFHAPVAPGAALVVRLAQGNGIAFTVTCGQTRVASGTLALAADAPRETSGHGPTGTGGGPS